MRIQRLHEVLDDGTFPEGIGPQTVDNYLTAEHCQLDGSAIIGRSPNCLRRRHEVIRRRARTEKVHPDALAITRKVYQQNIDGFINERDIS